MRRRNVWLGALLSGLCLLVSATSVVAERPDAPGTISPGKRDVSSRIFDRCPTFSWGLVEGARGYELQIYEIESRGGRRALVEPPKKVEIEANTSSWTASGDLCLGGAGRYAWTVRAVTKSGATAWAEPLLFSVERQMPPPAELRRILEEYLVQQSASDGVVGAGGATGGAAGGAAGVQAPVASKMAPKPVEKRQPPPLLAETAPFYVDGSGGVVGKSFALMCDSVAIYHLDVDEDGYGNPTTRVESCAPIIGYVDNGDDCDDGTDEVNPGVTEVCGDKIDNDCDGAIDEETAWWPDQDGDSFGDASSLEPIIQCLKPLPTYVDNRLDCDDGNPIAQPGEVEVCGDGIDNDCDGVAVETRTWWEDQDGDGFGNESSTVSSCLQPSGYEDNGLDCDDTDPNQRPGAPEVCNGADDDCDFLVDEDCIPE